MKAAYNTESQLDWFKDQGITHLDFAARRENGAFIDHNTKAVSLTGTDRLQRTLQWLKAENCRNADIYCRPSRGSKWAYLFLDDLSDHRAITDQYRSMAIHTSPEGGYQLWIATTTPLNEDERRAAQEPLIAQYGADPGSKSGEHWGRLAGFKNHKRGGNWVNFTTQSNHPPLDSKTLSPLFPQGTKTRNGGQVVVHSPTRPGRTAGGVDDSESGKEYGWIINYLENGGSRQEAYRRLHARATARGKPGDIDRYVRRTLRSAETELSKQT
ncbi:MAG: hypothetical protein G8D91_00390 [gamma proteobacterium symbiont of Clathrolucina costata]